MANIRKHEGKTQIWDVVRRKWLNYSPEEGVRQWLAELLISKGVDYWRMTCEHTSQNTERRLRIDILVYTRESKPIMICECKAPDIPISDDTFLQAANYNLLMKVPYLLVTNGTKLYCAKVDLSSGSYQFLDTIPQI